MAGKPGRSGRKPGSLSWFTNPTALAARHLDVLTEMWLAGVPIQVGPDRWLVQPTGRKYTAPPKIRRALAAVAIKHFPDMGLRRPTVDAVLTFARPRGNHHISVTLRRRRAKSTVAEAAYRQYVEDRYGSGGWWEEDFPSLHQSPRRSTTRVPGYLRALKAAMAAAHPDRGGSNEAFIKAHKAYVTARRERRATRAAREP